LICARALHPPAGLRTGAFLWRAA